MNALKQYFKNLMKEKNYRGWHLVQAEKIAHGGITKALLGIQKLAGSKGIFLAIDKNLKTLNREMQRKRSQGSALSIRKQVLVNLDTFGFIQRSGKGQTQEIRLTEKAHEYLDYENKEFFMDDFLSKFEMKKERLIYSIIPYPVLLRILSDKRIHGLLFKEFQYFVSQIKSDNDIHQAVDLILRYRKLSNAQKETLDNFILNECKELTSRAINGQLPKEFRRDYGNWSNNAKHSLEFFNLGSQIKFYKNEVHLLLGSDEFKKKILSDLN